jgi:hypothetical protein
MLKALSSLCYFWGFIYFCILKVCFFLL